MNNAIRKRLGDIVNFKRGYDLPSYNRMEGNYPIISSGGISGYHSEYKKDGEGLITGRYGTLGEMYYINGKYWPHNTALYVTDFKGNYPKYVYYLMKCLGNLKTSDKSTVPGVNRNDLHEIVIPYIKPEFQKEIADLLFMIDDKIKLNNRINLELEAMAKTLYDYWFVQFDFPDKNGKPYKTSGGKMVWNDKIKRMLPENWSVSRLSENVTWISGAQPSKSTFIYQEKIGYVRFIQNRDYASDSHKTYIKESKNNKLCDTYDIMIDKYGDAGAVRYGLSGAYNVALSKIEVNIKNGQEYIRNYLKSDSVYMYLKNACIASTRASLNSENLDSLNIILPECNILEKFEVTNKEFIKMTLQTYNQNQKLTELRDWLLPMLMNGQVKVN